MTSSLYLSTLIIIVFITEPSLANIIDTNGSNSFQNQHIYCDEGEDCTIICDVLQACFQSEIHCPANYACNIQCIADSVNKQVCGAAKFNCSQSSECNILCRAETNDHACDNANVKWPINSDQSSQSSLSCQGDYTCANLASSGKIQQGWDPIKASNDNEDYTLICDGQNSCHNNIIQCPTNASCSILCSGYSSCLSNTIHCGNNANSQCNVTCRNEATESISGSCQNAQFTGIGTVICDGARSCSGLTFPISPDGEPYYLDCNDPYSCSESTVICPTDSECHIRCKGESSCTGMDITWPPSSYPASLTCLDDNACTNNNVPDHVERLSFGPTLSPTSYPVSKYGVTVNIIFSYTHDDANISYTDIQLFTEEITQLIIEDSLFNQSITCSQEQYQFNITLKEIDITVQLELCNQIEATKIIAYLNKSLVSDIVEQYEQEPDILIASTPSVQIVMEQVIETISISTTGDTVSSTNVNPSMESDNKASTVIIAMVVIICVLVIVIASLLYCYLKKISVRKETLEMQLEKELEAQQIEIEQREQQTQLESTNSANNLTKSSNVTTISDEMHDEVDDDRNEDLYTKNGEDDEDLYNKNDDELMKGKITPFVPKATPKQEPTPLGDV